MSQNKAPLDLIHYFLTKLKKLEDHNQTIETLIEKYKGSGEKTIMLEEKLIEREEDAFRIQDSLNKAQLVIYEEREAYLKLRLDYSQLKIERDDFRRKFQTALLLGGKTEKDVTNFLERHPRSAELTDEMIQLKQQIHSCSAGDKVDEFTALANVTLRQEMNRLEKAYADLYGLREERILSLETSHALTIAETGTRITQLQNRLAASVDQVKEKTNLLHRSLVQNVELQKKLLMVEDQLTNRHKSNFQIPLNTNRENVEPQPVGMKVGNDTSETVRRLERNSARLEGEVMKKSNAIRGLKLDTIRLEKEMNKLREETEVSRKTSEIEIKRLLERNKILRNRLQQLDSRRRLDGAGFRAEVQEINKFLSAIKKSLDRVSKRKEKVGEVLNPVPIRPQRSRSATTAEHGGTQFQNIAVTVPIKKNKYHRRYRLSEKSLRKIVDATNHKVQLLDQLIKKRMMEPHE